MMIGFVQAAPRFACALVQAHELRKLQDVPLTPAAAVVVAAAVELEPMSVGWSGDPSA